MKTNVGPVSDETVGTHFSSVCPTKENLEKIQKEKRRTNIENLKRNEELKNQQEKNAAQKMLFLERGKGVMEAQNATLEEVHRKEEERNIA